MLDRNSTSRPYAAKMKGLTVGQLFRIANYVPNDVEIQDDAGLASIFGQVRAAIEELEKRNKLHAEVRKNPPSSGVPAGWKSSRVTPPSSLPAAQRPTSGSQYRGHHFWSQQVPARMARIANYPAQRDRVETALELLNLARNRIFPAGPDGMEPADLRGLRDGEYAFQTSGVPGFAGDYLIAKVERGNLAYFKTLYTTDPALLRDASGGYSQFDKDQMIPNWSTITVQYDAYVPELRGKTRRGKRSSNGTSPLEYDDRQVVVGRGIQQILKKYGPSSGEPLRWQDIVLYSEIDPDVAKGAPYLPGEVADRIRQLLANGEVSIVKWERLPWADPNLPLHLCTAKNCEPFFGLGRQSFLSPQTKAKKNPKVDALDGLRREYAQLRNEAIRLALKHNYATTRDPDKLRAGFDLMVENVREGNGIEKTPEGYIMAAHWALNMIKVTTVL